jgi:hypothetical protein
MKKNQKIFEWEEILSFIDGKPNSFLLTEFLESSQDKTDIVRKLIKERKDRPDSYPTGGEVAMRQERVQSLLESLSGKAGFTGNLLILYLFYDVLIIFAAIILAIILFFTVSNNSASSDADEWFCNMVDGEKECYRNKDIEEMVDKYRN